MNSQELTAWFEANKALLEGAYLGGQQPWQQSGFGLRSNRTEEQWEAQRRPVADCMDRSGTFLDIGCANGFLMESVVRWTAERGIKIIPYGLDVSEKLVSLARERLPELSHHMFTGNAWDWMPPQRFDYVRTELVYVPDELHKAFVARLLESYLSTDGRLLVAQYRDSSVEGQALTVDRYLTDMGFAVESVRSGFRDGVEQTRIAVVARP